MIYNWGHRTNDGGAKAVNLVGNYYIPGAASKVFHILMPDFGSRSDPQQYYMADNVMEGHPEYSPDNWANGGSQLQPSELKKVGVNESEALALIRLNRPFCESGITVHSAQQAYESVLADVGANFPKYDSVDERILSDVLKRKTTAKGSKTGTPGIIDSQNDAGGYPVMKGGQAPVDSDQDGLPDAWESARGLNPKDAADSAKEAINGRGYTNLEVYLNTLGRTW